jgi:hypothetical protein
LIWTYKLTTGITIRYSARGLHSQKITDRTAPAAVYEKIMFRKAIKNFEMAETFVELEMYLEII